MKRTRIIGLCLVALFAMGALFSAAASAAKPEWGVCTKLATSTGKYKDKACTTLKEKKHVPVAEGKYEWVAPVYPKCVKLATSTGKYKDKACTQLKEKKHVPVEEGKYEKVAGLPGAAFTATLPPGKLSNALLPAVECTAGTGSGTITLPKGTEKVKLTFTGCTTASGAVKCTTGAEASGTIVTESLKGTLIYVPGKKVGLLLSPEAPAVYFATFACPPVGTIRAAGKVIGEMEGDVNAVSKNFKMKFAGNGAGAQEFTSEETGILGEDKLNTEVDKGSGFVNYGASSEETLVSAIGPELAIGA